MILETLEMASLGSLVSGIVIKIGANLFSILTSSNVSYIPHLMFAGRVILTCLEWSSFVSKNCVSAIDNELVTRSLIVQLNARELSLIYLKLKGSPKDSSFLPVRLFLCPSFR